MDIPSPESTVVLSGLLPAASLIQSLLLATGDLVVGDTLPSLQLRNTITAIQRFRLISSLLDDLRIATTKVPFGIVT